MKKEIVCVEYICDDCGLLIVGGCIDSSEPDYCDACQEKHHELSALARANTIVFAKVTGIGMDGAKLVSVYLESDTGDTYSVYLGKDRLNLNINCKRGEIK